MQAEAALCRQLFLAVRGYERSAHAEVHDSLAKRACNGSAFTRNPLGDMCSEI